MQLSDCEWINQLTNSEGKSSVNSEYKEVGKVNSRDSSETVVDNGTVGAPCELNLRMENIMTCDLRHGAPRVKPCCCCDSRFFVRRWC